MTVSKIFPFISERVKGVVLSVLVGLAAVFLSNQYAIPVMLVALLLGLSLHFLYEVPAYQKGFAFSAKTLLRVGVALLGIRISLSQVYEAGWQPIAILFVAVVSTILIGMLLAKILGCPIQFGLLSGGSVAICGASAAMAISSVLPDNESTKKQTIFTVIGVTTLSTVAMILYPIFVNYVGYDDLQKGLFLGGTIHDVAQVTGAGFSVSTKVGDMSVFFKLVRVAMLVPIVVVVSFIMYRLAKKATSNGAQVKVPAVPTFLIGFVLLILLNSFVDLPLIITDSLTTVSKFLLVIAIAALGVQTSLKEITQLGIKPIILITLETLFIATVVYFMI